MLLRLGTPNPTASALPSCPLLYSLPCRIYNSPSIKYIALKVGTRPTVMHRFNILYGGAGGIRARVQNLFLSASYNHTKIHIVYFSMEVRVRFELTTFRICNPVHLTALPSHYVWRSYGVTIPIYSSDSAVCVREHFKTYFVTT